MAGIVVSNKVRRLVGNRLKEIDVPTATLNTALYYADLAAQGVSFTQSRVNSELNAYPTVVKNNASLVLTPSVNKAGVVYAMNGDTKTLEEFEFERGSSGTYFDASGVMQLAGPNVPRINFENGASKGLLIEPTSSNLKLNSGFTEGLNTWVGGFTLVNTGWSLGPLLAKGAQANSTQNIWWSGSDLIEGKMYTLSCYIKIEDGSFPKIGVASGDDFMFLITNIPTYPTIKHIGNGVYFISGSRVAGGGNKTTGLYKGFGAGSSSKLLVATGFQLEEGPIATSYIPTTNAIATRLADKVLSKRPTVVFNKNSMNVKTAEYPATWMGNGLNDKNISGRNLLLGTMQGVQEGGVGVVDGYFQGFAITKVVGTGAASSDCIARRLRGDGFAEDTTYVASFWAKASTSMNILCYFFDPNTTTSAQSSTGQTSSAPDGAINVSVNTSWQKYWVRWTQTNPQLPKRIIIGRILYSSDTLEIAALKFECGSNASDWTPAPEDYIKINGAGAIEISSDEPIHIQQLSLISRELKQEEV